jgi:hypothetical protein
MLLTPYLVSTRCHQCTLIAHVGDVSTTHARCQGSQPLCVEVNVLGQLQLCQMNPVRAREGKGNTGSSGRYSGKAPVMYHHKRDAV